MDYDSYLSPFSLRFFLIFKELLIITFSYNLQLILSVVSDCISVPKQKIITVLIIVLFLVSMQSKGEKCAVCVTAGLRSLI